MNSILLTGIQLSTLDWGIIAAFFIVSVLIGLYTAKSAGKSAADYFLSGRSMPWWLLGFSMVATTFSADTPNLVTDIVRNNGVAGNWVWWAYLLTGMLTVFIYARWWRRSGLVTDLEFYEMRYSGGAAAFLRGFRAIYLGVVFNILVMATVSLAGIKIGSVMLGLTAGQSLILIAVVTLIYSTLGGLRGILYTDFFQFILAMIGSVWAAIYLINLPEVGGLDSLINHPVVQTKLDMTPEPSSSEFWYIFLLPLAVQWWASYYPGSEPGGGGYIVQRMLSAKNEAHATGATLFFNIVHYAMRPWPWILIALASLVVYPSLDSLKEAFPHVSDAVLKDDLAYPAMLTHLPKGLVGLIIASLIAALMSTLSTQLNWGSSYIVNDVYKRFFKPEASEKQMVAAGRIATIVLMILACTFALYLENAKRAFDLIVQVGAGTGLVYILRWVWWRINAYTEIVAMIASIVVAIILNMEQFDEMASHVKLLAGVGITTVAWLIATFVTPATDKSVLQQFYSFIKPYNWGWKPFTGDDQNAGDSATFVKDILLFVSGSVMVYSWLFCLGYMLYGKWNLVGIMFVLGASSTYYIYSQRNYIFQSAE